jgi:predicted DNA-binding protein (MmcQ/YjbR family)
MARASDVLRLREALRECALGYPEAYEDFPWGESVIKVRKKIFLFMGGEDGPLSISVKLPASSDFALTLPGCERTGHGLGRAGWVTVRCAPGEEPGIDLLEDWIDESYRAVAPKRLVAALEAAG